MAPRFRPFGQAGRATFAGGFTTEKELMAGLANGRQGGLAQDGLGGTIGKNRATPLVAMQEPGLDRVEKLLQMLV